MTAPRRLRNAAGGRATCAPGATSQTTRSTQALSAKVIGPTQRHHLPAPGRIEEANGRRSRRYRPGYLWNPADRDVGGGLGEVDAGGEQVQIGDQITTEAGRELDHAGPALGEPQLGVGGADLHGERLVGGGHDLADLVFGGDRLAGRYRVSDLLEMGRKVDVLAGRYGHEQRAARDDALDAVLGTVEILLHKDAGGDAEPAFVGAGGEIVGAAKCRGVIDPGDADAAGQGARLDNDRIAELSAGRGGVLGSVHQPAPRARHPGLFERRAHRVLVSASLQAGGAVRRQAEPAGDVAGDRHRCLVVGEHAVEAVRAGEDGDRGGDVVGHERDGPVSHRVRGGPAHVLVEEDVSCLRAIAASAYSRYPRQPAPSTRSVLTSGLRSRRSDRRAKSERPRTPPR